MSKFTIPVVSSTTTSRGLVLLILASTNILAQDIPQLADASTSSLTQDVPELADVTLAVTSATLNNNLNVVLSAYYSPVMQSILPAGASPFQEFSSLAGIVNGVPYTAGMEPGIYPYYQPIVSSSAWLPSINAWFMTNNLAYGPSTPATSPVLASGSIANDFFVITPPPSFIDNTKPPQLAMDEVPYVTSDGSIIAPPTPDVTVTADVPVLAAGVTGPRALYPITLGAPTTKLWNGKNLRALKIAYSYGNGTKEAKVAVDGIIARAKVEAAKTNYYSVTLQTLLRVPGSTKNDYVSIGPYMWPCDSYPKNCKPRWGGGKPVKCDTKTHMPWISCDLTGQKNPSIPTAGLGDVQFSNYWAAMTDLSLAYYYTEDKKYATRAATLTRRFFLTATSLMNPNMKFSQLWPGVRNGSPSGIVEILKLVEIIDCIEILKLAPTIWTTTDNRNMVTWARRLLSWYNTDPLGIQARDATNNIALWWHHTMLSVALYTGDATSANTIAARMAVKIDQQVAPNGTLIYEVVRPTSRQYTAYALTAIMRTATMSAVTRTRLWTRPRVVAAAAFNDQFVNGKAPWPWPDTQTTYDWKFWAEWLKLAANALKNQQYQQDYLATGGASVRGFGVPPAAVYL